MMHERPATDGTGNQNFRPQTRKKTEETKTRQGHYMTRRDIRKEKNNNMRKINNGYGGGAQNVILYPWWKLEGNLGLGNKNLKSGNISKSKT